MVNQKSLFFDMSNKCLEKYKKNVEKEEEQELQKILQKKKKSPVYLSGFKM